jgi:hypothetical protein
LLDQVSHPNGGIRHNQRSKATSAVVTIAMPDPTLVTIALSTSSPMTAPMPTATRTAAHTKSLNSDESGTGYRLHGAKGDATRRIFVDAATACNHSMSVTARRQKRGDTVEMTGLQVRLPAWYG